jgi:hypothetical protein
MRVTRLLIPLFAVAASGGAQAITCNIVFDRANAVVYQDVNPPVDMSERGAAARDRMRQRGEQLMIIDTDQCPRLVFSTIANSASVDEIVAGMRPYIGVSGGMGSSARPGASGNVAAIPTAGTQAPINVAPGRY